MRYNKNIKNVSNYFASKIDTLIYQLRNCYNYTCYIHIWQWDTEWKFTNNMKMYHCIFCYRNYSSQKELIEYITPLDWDIKELKFLIHRDKIYDDIQRDGKILFFNDKKIVL